VRRSCASLSVFGFAGAGFVGSGDKVCLGRGFVECCAGSCFLCAEVGVRWAGRVPVGGRGRVVRRLAGCGWRMCVLSVFLLFCEYFLCGEMSIAGAVRGLRRPGFR
jgi:hypothetical protein